MNMQGSTLIAVALFALAPLASAQVPTSDEHAAHHAGEQATSAVSDAEVRRVNKETQKITLRHGELKNLGMPPMTMVFRVADPAILDQVKAGDKVKFVADKVGGEFTIMRIEAKE